MKQFRDFASKIAVIKELGEFSYEVYRVVNASVSLLAMNS